MNEMTLTHSPQETQQPELYSDKEQRSPFSSRRVMLSLIVFALSFIVLFAGPALALRLMASSVQVAGPSEGPGGYSPDVYASATVTEVVLQQGKRPWINNMPVGPVYTGTKDTYMNKWKPTDNFWSESRLVLGQSGAYRPLISFDLDPALIPTNATVISSQLGIYCNARNLFASMEASVYEVIRPWDPQEVTWQRASVGTPWTLEGCDHPGTDRVDTPAHTRIVFDRNVHQYFDVTSIVQNWVANPADNKGFLLVGPDPAVIYYYRNSRFTNVDHRPKLVITWTIAAPPPTPTPTPTSSPTPGPSPTPTQTRTPTPIPGAEVILDETSACYTHTLGVWQTGTGGGYGGDFEYENVTSVVTASWRPCSASPLPVDSMYEVYAHWSVHSLRPVAVPYEIHYDGGSTTVYVDQTKDATGSTPADFSPSGWYSLGVYPFRAGTYATTGEYVELSSPPDASVTCADAVRWLALVGHPGPPHAMAVSASPTELPSDGASTSTIAVTVTDKYGNLVADGTMVGLTTTLGTLPYAYVEAEDAAVTKLGTWPTGFHSSASGGAFVRTDNFGDETSWTFWGEAVSMIYRTNVGGGTADVSVDGSHVATINFASASSQWRVERQLATSLSPGWHTVRVRSAGAGRIWLDAFRAGAKTTGGVATAALVAPNTPGTATVRAVALGAGLTGSSPSWPYAETTVSFPGPLEVWVDDDYCSICPNDGHLWNYTAFDTIQDGVDEVLSGGTVHVAAGTYLESVTVDKPLSLLGAGSDVTVVDGISDTPGSRGFYVDRADNVTISGFKVRDFETGIHLRGTGSGPGPRVYNASIVYNAFESNDAGSNSYALRGTYVYTSTICSNDITLGYNGVYLQNAYGTVICYNDIYANKGFGVKIDTGDDNSVDNNNIYDNQNVGIELAGATLRNGVYGNVLYDLWWDGVLINGASDVQVAANVISNTNLVWLDAGGSPPDANHNLGGVVLMNTTNSAVYDNRISAVSNAEGNRADAAGVYLRTNTVPIAIDTNLIRGCAGHGIHIPGGGGKATIHGNSIYGNGRFGLNNVLAAILNAEGNWWGRNTPTFGLAEPADIRDAPTVFWSPPISLSLSAAPTLIPANGVATSAITASASGFGYNILDGTWITFTNTGDYGTLVFPSTAVFGAGQANTTLRAGIIAGVETITGTAEPGIEGQIVTVTLTALGPHSIAITADPKSVEVGGGPQGESTVTAVVRDIYGNGVPLVPVTFSSDALGGVSPFASTTVTGTGAAMTTFTSGGLPGVATVTATAGVTLTASTNITITTGPPCTGTIAAIPSGVPANGVATSTITVALTDCVGYPVSNGTMVGFTTTNGSILTYEYVEAESADVITSTGWTVGTSATASGGKYIGTSSAGAAAYWTFRGEAISLIYRRFASGGVMRVRVDGGTPVDINTAGTPAAWLEQVIATNLNPMVTHQIEVTHQGGTIRLDAFRSGAVTNGGIATAILRAPVSAITETGTVYATSALGHPVVPQLVLTTTVVFSRTDVVWVDDDWTGLPNGTPVPVPGGTAYIGNSAFDTIPLGVAAVQPAGTVYVLPGDYPLPVNITKTLNLLGAGSTSTFIVGSGTGNGIRVRPNADGTTIEGFTIRSFDYGVYLDGRTANNLDGVTFADNVITGSVTGAITATYVNSGYFADNALHGNSGFGFDLHRGNSDTFRNNHVYNNTGFGVRVRRTSGADISYNNVHDVDWDGIHVGVNCANTSVLSNTVHTTNNSASGFDDGGIVLNSTTNSTVEYNTVYDVGTAGGVTDTAGVWVGGTNSGGTIHYNRLLNNANQGVMLDSYTTPPTVHCNHIYGNGRYGLFNNTGVDVHAEGNWWGHNPPLTFHPTFPADIRPAADVFWNPPISLTVTAAQPTVIVGGPAILITATACGGGCCVWDGTPITFTTDLGFLGPSLASTVLDTISGGQAMVWFTPGIQAGTSTITATIPNAGVATTTVTIQPGLPASIIVAANPTSIPVGTGMSAIGAVVLDIYGNTVTDTTLIDFDTTLGWTLPPTNTTIGGYATTTLYSGVTPGIATVSAAWSYIVGYTNVQIIAGPPFTITSMVANPPWILANGIDTSSITATVLDQYSNLVPDGTMVGFTTTAGSLIHAYVEAESAEVITSTGWTAAAAPSASGGYYIRTSTAGAEAYWTFRGQAVSLIYRQYATGGQMRVRVDGGTPVDIDTSGTAAWVEQVIATNLNPAVMHEIRVTCVSGQIRLDAFRSGAATSDGQAMAVLTSSPLPATTARVWATAIGGTFPTRTVDVPFLAPLEVWVDDDYCATCFNDGHMWNFDAFSNIPAGVTAARSGGTVHVLAGTYTLPVTINKPLYLDGEGSGATSSIVGSGTGNGIRVTRAADGTTVDGFLIRDFNYGIYLDGRAANNLDGITVTNCVITGSVTGAITATYVNDGYLADNALHHNSGFGFDLHRGNSDAFRNNHAYNNTGFGVRVRGTSGADISYNNVHDVDWDGIRLQGGSNTTVLSNTVHTTNNSPSSFDDGGIVLNSTTNATVEYNTVTNVGTAGGGTDTAGVWVGGTNSGGTIHYNRLLNNANQGVMLDSYTTPPTVHCNHIYGNGRYGLRNITGVDVHAEGNWWGHNPPLTFDPPSFPADITPAADVFWSPPISLTVTAPMTVPAGSPPVAVTATACGWGCCVWDGTSITFTTDLGGLGSPPGPSVLDTISGGQAMVMFTPGSVMGTATITATIANAGVATTTVTIAAGPPFSMTITAAPPSIWVKNCRPAGKPWKSTIAITVTDQFGNPCVGDPVTYTVSAGLGASLEWTTGVLDANGYHFTRLRSADMAGTALVTATAGTVSESVPVEIMASVPVDMALDRAPAIIAADGVSTSTITATVRDGCSPFHNLAYDGTMVGFTTTRGSLIHDYVEAEGSAVDKSVGDWSSLLNANASGGELLYTNNPGAWAEWQFMGSAVSLIYRRATNGGTARVYVDGVLVLTPALDPAASDPLDMWAGSTEWQRETVAKTGLDSSVPHTIRIECITARVYLDAFRSGATTVNGVATAVLTSEKANVIANIVATAVDSRLEAFSGQVQRSTTVQFRKADLAVSKGPDPVKVRPNELVDFTIYYTNTSALAQGTDTLITDTLPSGLTLVGSVSSPNVGMPSNPAPNVWVWHAGNVQPGASGEISLTARRVCPSGLITVTNYVSITSLTLETNMGDNSDTSSVIFEMGPPFYVTVTASPQSIETDSSTTIRIEVTDQCLIPIQGATVYISTNLGAFDSAGTQTHTTGTTNINGRVTRTFWSRPPISGTATIEATAVNADGSATGVGYVFIGVGPAEQCVATADPTAIPADGLSTSTISARVLDTGGNLVPDGFFVGFTTTLGSMLYDYVEDSGVNQSPPGSWTTGYDPQASGGSYLHTSVDGASVYWNFSGNGVTIVYHQAPGSGIGDVYLDGSPLLFIDMKGPNRWRAERVYTWTGSPTETHTLRLAHRPGTGPIYMDAFRSGVTTSGGQALALLTSEPVTGTATVAATAVSETVGIIPELLPAFVDVRFDPADVAITKTVEPAGQVSIGQRVTFTLTYQNLGPITATNAYVDDTISDGISAGWLTDLFFSQQPITVTPYLQYRWPLGSLAPGDMGTITFGGTIDTSRYWPSGTVVTNTARIDSSTLDPRRGNNTRRVTITIVSGASAGISLTATPGSIPVGGSTSTLRATVRDMYGNPAPNGTPVTFTTTLGGFPVVQERVRTTSGGVATLNLTSGDVVGTAYVTAALDSLTANTQVIFTPLAPFTVTVTADPDHITVGGSTSVIRAEVVDQYGNWVANGTVVAFSTSAGTINPPSATTINGTAFTVLTSGTVAGTATITGTAGTASGTTTVVFESGEPRVTIDADPRILKVGEVSIITVRAKDQFGNDVTDGTVVTFTTTLGYFTDVLTDTTHRPTSGGAAVARLTSTTPGTAIVRGMAGTDSASVAVTFDPGEPYDIEILSVEPGVVPGCGGTALATAEVWDRYGNPVRDGTVVVFDVVPQGDVDPIDGGRTTNGVAKAIIASGTVPGPALVHAWPKGYRTSAFDDFPIVFEAGPPDRLEASAEPPRLLVGGNRATIKAHVLDCGGNAVDEGTLVTFTLVSGQGSLSPQTATTGNGWAYSYLTSPDQTGSATVRVTSGDQEGMVVVEYIPGPPFDITLTADPLSIPANGVSTSIIGAEVKDLHGNAVADRTTVVFSTELGRFETGASYTTSVMGGRASAVLTSSSTAGIARVAALTTGKRGEIYVDFYFGPTPAAGWTQHLPIIFKHYPR